MSSYVGETTLREMTLEVMRTHVPAVTGIRLVSIRGPVRPGNWRVEWINVLAGDYGAARDLADELEASRRWIMVPDGHALDGQVRQGDGAPLERRSPRLEKPELRRPRRDDPVRIMAVLFFAGCHDPHHGIRQRTL